jgi:hypothetical protein
MRVTIFFDEAMYRHMPFFNALHTLFCKYDVNARDIKSSGGLIACGLSWSQSYELAANIIAVIRTRGLDHVHGIELHVSNDSEAIEQNYDDISPVPRFYTDGS